MAEGTRYKQKQENLQWLVDNLEEGVQEPRGWLDQMNDMLRSLVTHQNN